MLGKYDDYPNGIHEKHIEQADMNGLARIIDIFIAEYVLILEKEKISDVNAVKHISRYRIFADLLTSSLRKWNDNTLTLEEKILQASIYLGSMLEGSLQFFLFAFNTDYDSTEWKKWQTKGVDDSYYINLLNGITNNLDELVKKGSISAKQKKDLKKVIEAEINLRKEGRSINRIMLDELIGLFRSVEILEEKNQKTVYNEMLRIRDGRNSIHIFTDYEICSEETFINNLKAYCKIMQELLYRTRCLNGDEKREAIYEMMLGIPGANLILIDDEKNIIKCYGDDIVPRKKNFIKNIMKKLFRR